MKKAILALEDGTVYEGLSYGAAGEVSGEVVFNTSMTGYQEILTDPSYAGQLVTLTYPMIGNYGVNDDDYESAKPQANGFIVREGVATYSNYRATGGLGEWLTGYGVVGICEIDTRALTKRIRTVGAMRGVISTEDLSANSLVEKAKNAPALLGQGLVRQVTGTGVREAGTGPQRVTAIDYGAKSSIIDLLVEAGCTVRGVPAGTGIEEILADDPDGVFLSNGPGDPNEVDYAVDTIKGLLGKKPIFGICLGHQLLCQALGARTYKLKFGHRGGNQPVKNLATGRVEITSQNHGYAVDPESLPDTVEVTHLNLNDMTNEGIRCREIPAFSVQYHPEASPGPRDSRYLFDDFIELMGTRRGSGRMSIREGS